MSYVEENLIAGEEIVAIAKIHKIVYLPAAILAYFGIPPLFSSLSTSFWMGLVITFFCVLSAAGAYMNRKTTELALTNKRLIVKYGVIKHTTEELKLSKVESLKAEQGLLGRIFNYGTVIVSGTSLASIPLPFIADPKGFRKIVNEEVEKAESGQQQQPAPATETTEAA